MSEKKRCETCKYFSGHVTFEAIICGESKYSGDCSQWANNSGDPKEKQSTDVCELHETRESYKKVQEAIKSLEDERAIRYR